MVIAHAFSQVSSENSEQIVEQKDVGNGSWLRKGERGNLKLWMKKGNTSGRLRCEGTQRPLRRGPREPGCVLNLVSSTWHCS